MSGLLTETTSNHVRDFYCLNCLYSYRKEDEIKKHENICKNNDYCYIEMPKEDNKVLKYNRGEMSMKHPFVIYADLE